MIGDELKALFDRSMRANAQMVARVGGVLNEAVQVARDPQRRNQEEAKGLLGHLLRLQLDYLKDLSESSTRYLHAVSAMAGSAAPATAPAAPAPTALTGRPGETLAFQFQVDNPNPQPVAASIEAQDWVARDGGAGVGADSIALQPRATEIPAQGAATVSGRLLIDERFAPGRTYDTVIRVAGFPGHQVALSLAVV